MTELGEFQFEPEPVPPHGGPPRWQYAAVVVGGLALVAAAAVAVYLVRRESVDPVPPAAPPVADAAPIAEPVDATEEVLDNVEPVDLPGLDASDRLVRDLVAALSAHPAFVAWIATDDLIRTFAVVVDNMAEGQTPARHLGNLSPREPFLVSGGRQRPVIDPRSYARYDVIADAFSSLDVDGATQLYTQLEPLLDEAYRDLGHPDAGFDAAMSRAVRRILETPVVEQEVALVSRSVAFEFTDPALQSLAPVQRQALRMGPRNLRLVQRTLRELAGALELDVPGAP